MQGFRVRASMTARGRSACLLAILTLFGCTIFGVSGASGAATPVRSGGSGQAATGGEAATPNGSGNSGPVTGGTPGDPPTTGGGQGGSPTTGSGTAAGGNPSVSGNTKAGGGPLAIRPIAVPAPTTGNGSPGLDGGGRDHGDHGTGHPVCDSSGICNNGNDQPPASIPLTPSPPTTAPSQTHPSAPKPTTPATSGTFLITGESVVPTTHPAGNPSAGAAGLGSLSAPGATAGASARGLALLASATSAVGLRNGAGGGGHGSGGGGTGFPFGGGSPASRLFDYSGLGPSAILQIVNVVPTVVWIAIGALILLAASMGGAALLNNRQARTSKGQLERVRAVAKTDPLTGVLNRRGFTEAVERELARARRHGRPFVLAYVDVRGLKAVNDTEGHLAGDELLKGVATLLTESARADDVVGRIGGDELGLLLVEQAGDSAAAVTNRIKAQVAARRTELGLRTQWDLTVGTAAFPDDGGTFDELLAAADRRLYEQRGIALADGRV